jgi:hypothetical protein
MSKRILFLDDDGDRHRKFMMENIGSIVDQAYLVPQAIAFLDKNPPYDIASLDYDLDWQSAAGLEPIEIRGIVAVEHIVEMLPEKRPKLVIVHTHSRNGRNLMCQMLREADISHETVPFGYPPGKTLPRE